MPEEWLDPETGRTAEPPPWEPVPHRCHGCVTLNRERTALDEQAKNLDDGPAVDTEGITFRFKKPKPDSE